MKKTLCLVSLGCPKNLVDSEVLLGLLSKEGYTLTTNPSDAETIIINTCSFIEDATREATNAIHRYAQHKKGGRCQHLIVAGCLPQRYGKELEKQFPDVDLFVGSGALQKLPKLLAAKPSRKTFLSKRSFLYNERTPRILSTPPFTAYVKIAEGCSKACTFCTVPRIRGPYRSRRLRSILEEAKQLADQGVQELILIAQDTTAYGEDLKDGTNLEKLLRVLVRVDGIRWIRTLYSYPRARYFTDGLLETMAQEKKICPYLDLPIQHVDDEILKRMGRKVKGSEIRSLLDKIRTYIPHISLRTSLIVGFPGERQDQFQTLLDFVKKVEFDHLGAFKYSVEQGTPASRLSNQIPERVKEERLKKLMNLQKKISLKKYRSLVGEQVEVLVESVGGSQQNVKGRLQTQAPEIDGSVILEGRALPGDWVEAQIIKAFPYDVLGRIERHL
jgi:ribosomal protein S12 methylthiotransferase